MLQKMQSFVANKNIKKVMSLMFCFLIVGAMMIPSFAAEVPAVTDIAPEEAAKQVFATMHSVLNFATVLKIIAVALGSALAIFLGWWAIRKVSRMVMTTFTKGRVPV